jgi:serine phosphatase RsbU (regulator of sigma subunit)
VALAAAFVPAAERVSGDFYLVAEGPQDATVLVVGDVVGHGVAAARRTAFTRTTFVATAPYSYDPGRLLGWANAALTERATASIDYVTAACVTYIPREHRLRWAYAGHPPALWLDDPRELAAPKQGSPLGLGPNPDYVEGSHRAAPSAGMLLYTDGLTDARRGKQFFGLDGVAAALAELQHPSPIEAVDTLRARVAEFATDGLTRKARRRPNQGRRRGGGRVIPYDHHLQTTTKRSPLHRQPTVPECPLSRKAALAGAAAWV